MSNINAEKTAAQLLLELLLARPEYSELYYTELSFKKVVDGIVATMPALLRVAADTANKEKKEHLAKVQEMMHVPWMPTIGSGSGSMTKMDDPYKKHTQKP